MTGILKKRMQKFTIIEVVVAMAIFSILMLIIMQIFGAMQNVWTTTSKRTQTSQNANVIMNMLASDFQSACYDIEADAWSSWCYYQGNANLTNTPVWFITSRPKSVQASNSAQVLTGFWLEEVTKDGLTLYALKNLVISNIDYKIEGSSLKTSILYENSKITNTPDSILTNVHADLKKIAVLVDDNIVSMKITPYEWDSSGKTYKDVSSFPYQKLPRCIKIELQMLDDDVSVREAYKEADSTERARMVRTYTRVIEINRGQYYE